jgi:hypothetical protein
VSGRHCPLVTGIVLAARIEVCTSVWPPRNVNLFKSQNSSQISKHHCGSENIFLFSDPDSDPALTLILDLDSDPDPDFYIYKITVHFKCTSADNLNIAKKQFFLTCTFLQLCIC